MTTTHPDVEVLSAFAAGGLNAMESESVGQHVTQCEACRVRLDELPSESHLEQRLRGLQTADTPTLDYPAQEWLEQLKHLEPFLRPAEEELLKQLEPPERPGELGRLGRYRILSKLGSGGMGCVFKALHPVMDREVALKVISSRLLASREAVARFQREVRAVARLHHSNIVEAHDADSAGDVQFLVMEFVDGSDLAHLVRRDGALPADRAADYVRQAALALQHAFEKGMIHRDIKPANLMLTPDGQIKVLDLGLALLMQDQNPGEQTSHDTVLGTPDFMAPEQAVNSHEADIRADLYSLGCTLYFLLTGRVPFPGHNTVEKLVAHQTQTPQPLAQLRPEVPPELVAVVDRMMAKRPGDRFATPSDVADALAPFVGQRPTVASNRPTTQSRKQKLMWLSVASLLSITALVAIVVVKTDKGVLEIEGADENVEVHVKQNGKVVKLIDRKSGWKLNMPSGDYKLTLGTGNETLELDGDGGARIQRGKTTVARIRCKLPPPSETGPVDEAFVRAVAALKPEEQVEAVRVKLRKLNPDFDGQFANVRIVDGAVYALEFPTDHVTDISPVRALRGLRELVCAGKNPPRGELEDLSPLKGMTLTKLAIFWTKVRDLEPLRDMLSLKRLYCGGGTPLRDLSPLQGMKLEVLWIDGTQVSDLSPLRGLPLIELNCDQTLVKDLAPLHDSPLERLMCQTTPIEDFSVVKVLPLKRFAFDFQADRDAEWLRSLPKLEEINDKPTAEFWKSVNLPGTAPPAKPVATNSVSKKAAPSTRGASLTNATTPAKANRVPDKEKPFVVVSSEGKRRGEFKHFTEALADVQKDDVLEIHGSGPFLLGHVQIANKTLAIHAAPGYRPVFVPGPTASVDGWWFDVVASDLRIDGCDFRSPAPLGLFQSGSVSDVTWELRNCRFLGGLSIARFFGKKLRIEDCLISIRGQLGGVQQDAEVELTNNLVWFDSGLGLGFAGGQTVRLQGNTFVQSGATTALLPYEAATVPTRPVSVEASNNVFVVPWAVMNRVSGQADWLDQLRWQGRNNLYAGPRALAISAPQGEAIESSTLADWFRRWGEEPGSQHVPRALFQWDQPSTETTEEAVTTFKSVFAQLRREHPNVPADLGPNWELVGPGAAYVRHQEASGQPAETLARREPPSGGPFVVWRNARVVRAVANLQAAIDAAASGDTIIVHSDGEIPSVAYDTTKRLHLRAAPGFRPTLDGPLGSASAVEGFHFRKSLVAFGTDRFVNCSFDAGLTPSDSPAFASDPKQPLEIVNCLIAGAVEFQLSPNRKFTVQNSVVGAFVTKHSGDHLHSLELDRCVVWRPGPLTWDDHLLLSGITNFAHNPLAVTARYTLFETGISLLWNDDTAASVTWKGSQNVYRVGGGWQFQAGAVVGLDAWCRRFNSEELDSVEADPLHYSPTQWRLLLSSPGHTAGPNRRDLGADVGRVAK